LSAALAGITAAVVGVIANLALWFSLNTIFEQRIRVTDLGMDISLPVLSSLNIPMLVISMVAFILAFVFKTRLHPLLGICSSLGIAWILLFSTNV
jgi:chromate transporter